MSGRQHLLRSFIEERLTAAAVEIFGVVEKTISEYEEQVVQSKRELEQLRQHTTHQDTLRPSIQLYRTDSQPVCEELLSLRQLNHRQELMSSQEDEVLQHHSPQVKEEQVTDSQPVCEELLPLQQLNPRQELMSSQEDEVLQHHSPQVKEEQPKLSFIPRSETSVYNSGANGFVETETSSDSHLIPSYSNETVQHQSPRVKEEQVDIMVVSDSESSISNSGTNGFESGDSQPIPSYTTATLIASHDVTNECNESEGLGLTFSQSEDVFSMEQKVCRFCRKQCRSFSDLVKHVEECHVGQKAFKCPECEKEFARRDKLTIHCRIHSGIKPHSCPVCGRSFNQRSNFTVHMRTHTGVKPHCCPVCKKSFIRSTTLKDHMRVHTGKTAVLW